MIAGTRRVRPLALLRYAALVLIATALVLPVYWILMSSLRPADQIFRHAGTFSLETLVPLQLTFDNFRFIFSGTFPRALFNSMFICVATVTLGASLNAIPKEGGTPWRPPWKARCSCRRTLLTTR